MPSLLYLCVLLAIATVANAELICPGYAYYPAQPPCVNQCSADKDTCGTGKKCCYTPQPPCGFQCMVGKNNATKAGKCPAQQSNLQDPKWLLCDGHFCDVDSDCKCKKKCCPNKCGSKICIWPQ